MTRAALAKFIAPLAAIAALVAFAACGASSRAATPTAAPAQTATAAPTATVAPTPAAAPAPSPTVTITVAPPTPTATVAPSPAPTAAPWATPAPRVDGLADDVFGYLETLTADYSPRESATAEELAAANFLRDELEGLGYEASLEEFDVILISDVRLKLSSSAAAGTTTLLPLPIMQSSAGKASAPLSDAGRAFAGDVAGADLAGRVALIERGDITFSEKVERVADAGAVAAVVFNNSSGSFRGSFVRESPIPAVAISQEDGRYLLELMGEGEIVADVSVERTALQSRNVIADKRGYDPSAKTVVIGAHYDTVPNTQGASDNGSGAAMIMTVARLISERSYPYDLRIILFGAEEIGLFGSRHHVDAMSDAEIADIRAMLNFDAFGSGSRLVVSGDGALLDAAAYIGAELGIDMDAGGEDLSRVGSDHAPFHAAGVPALFVISNDITRINSPADRIQHIAPELLGDAAALSIALLDWLAAE